MATTDLNRIKAVLAEQSKTAKWLAGEIEKDPATVSKWCTNKAQPSIETLSKIAQILRINVRELLVPTQGENSYTRID